MPTNFEERRAVVAASMTHPEANPSRGTNAHRLKAVAVKLAVPSFCALLLVPSLIHLASNPSIWQWDQSFYGITTLQLWHKLATEPAAYLANFALQLSGSRAPGIFLVGQFFVPIGMALGSIDLGLMLSILLELAVCLALVVSIGRSLKPNNAAVPFIGALAIASTPHFFYLSQNYFVESLQILAATYFFWILATFEKRRADWNFVHLIFATSVCLPSKVSSPMYCVVPGLVVFARLLIWHFKELLPKSKTVALALSMSVLTLGLVALWYLQNLLAIWDFVRDVSAGDIALHYGRKAPFLQKIGDWLAFIPEWWIVPSLQVILPVVLVVPFLSNFRKPASEARETASLRRSRTVLLITAIVQIVFTLTVVSLNVATDNRYLVALLPAVATIMMVACASVTSKRYFAILTGLLVFQFCSAYQSGVLAAINSKNEFEPAGQEVRHSELKRLSTIAAHAGKMLVVGVSLDWLNANSINYEAQKLQTRGLPLGRAKAWGIGDSQDQIHEKLNKIKSFVFVGMSPDMVRRECEFDWMNPNAAPILEWIRTVGRRVEFDSRLGLEVYEVEL